MSQPDRRDSADGTYGSFMMAAEPSIAVVASFPKGNTDMSMEYKHTPSAHMSAQ
jgi:hypothetical protein